MYSFARRASSQGVYAKHFKCVSPGKFRACAERAKAGALALMQHCSDYTQDQLWNSYVRFCAGFDPHLGSRWLPVTEEVEDGAEALLLPVPSSEETASVPSAEEATALLAQCKAISEIEEEGMTIKDDAARDDTRISGRNRASGARTFPDFHLLAGLGTAGSPVSNDEPVAGKTLFKALQHCKSTEDMWPRLFHLSVFLRYGHGCDSKILPAPNCRRQSKKLNWQQLAEREAAVINKQLLVSAARVSRMAAWRSLATECSSQLANRLSVPDRSSALEPPVSLQKGSVVLALPSVKPESWQLMMVSMVWRVAVKNRKKTCFLASPTLPVPMEQVESLRGYVLEADTDTPGHFTCNEESLELRLLPTCIAFQPRLCDASPVAQSPTGASVQLHADAIAALEDIKVLDDWPDDFKKEEQNEQSSSPAQPVGFFARLAAKAKALPKASVLKPSGKKKKQAEKGKIFKACQVLKQKHAALSLPLSGSMPEHFSRTAAGRKAIKQQLCGLADMEKQAFTHPCICHDGTINWSACRTNNTDAAPVLHLLLVIASIFYIFYMFLIFLLIYFLSDYLSIDSLVYLFIVCPLL